VQVSANQLLLAPIVLCAVFAWNLGLTGQGGAAIQEKVQRDLVPSMLDGERPPPTPPSVLPDGRQPRSSSWCSWHWH
jgi:hypothetical protein